MNENMKAKDVVEKIEKSGDMEVSMEEIIASTSPLEFQIIDCECD